nr:MAG TPA_asm: hypothetical protein [Caudoviricetes sp.]
MVEAFIYALAGAFLGITVTLVCNVIAMVINT